MASNFKTRFLVCSSCNEEFAFTVEAQEYFAEKGFVDDPQMCKSCYLESKRGRRSNSDSADTSTQKEKSRAGSRKFAARSAG